MPRNRRDDNDLQTSTMSKDIEEDYLDVDKPLSGQNYYCISFVSPEKVLEQKDKFLFYHYERAVYKKLSKMFDDSLSKIIDNSNDGNVDVADIIALKKSVDNSYKEYDVSFDKFKDMFEDFKFQNEEKIGEDFDKANSYRTSIRGVKVRGVFDTKREADVRAAVLQRQDALFDVFVGQIGYWCPWDPNPQKIGDIEYMNNDLNKLVKEYKANEVKKDMFYQEQKTQRQKDSLNAEDRLKHQEGLTKMREYRETMQKAEKAKADAEAKASEAGTETGSETPQTVDSSLLIDNTVASGTTLDSLLNISDDLESLNSLESSTVEKSDLDSNQPQAITQSLELGGEDSKEITLEDETKQLMSDDPWMQRKMAEKAQAQAQAQAETQGQTETQGTPL